MNVEILNSEQTGPRENAVDFFRNHRKKPARARTEESAVSLASAPGAVEQHLLDITIFLTEQVSHFSMG